MWGVSAEHPTGSGASLDPQHCPSLTQDSPVYFLVPAPLTQGGQTGLTGIFAVHTWYRNTKSQFYPRAVCCLHEGFAQGKVYGNCSLFFIVLINYYNKNAIIAFYFLLWLSIVAARAFLQVNSSFLWNVTLNVFGEKFKS